MNTFLIALAFVWTVTGLIAVTDYVKFVNRQVAMEDVYDWFYLFLGCVAVFLMGPIGMLIRTFNK